MTTIRQWAWANLVPTAMKRGWFGRTVWCGLCVVGDVCADMLLRSAMSGMILTDYCTEDVLAIRGMGRRLPRYPGETVDQYRARVWDAWDAWEFAGADKGILGQMRAAGYAPNTRWLRTTYMWEPLYGLTIPYVLPSTGFPEQGSFILVLAADPGSDEASCPTCSDGAVCAEQLVCGCSIAYDQVVVLSSIIHKFKPAEMVCKAIYFVDQDNLDRSDVLANSPRIIPLDTPRY